MASAQSRADSVQPLSEIVVHAFEQNENAAAASIHIIDSNLANCNQKTSLTHVVNTIPGVRMEERSPGSYRINIRGSSLRSPFGVRNVKVYWNDIPVTDPGGNTYFNQFAYNNFSSIEVFKGPASSMYGAGTGGLIVMNNPVEKTSNASLEYITGSYGLHNIFATGNYAGDKFATKITYAHNQANGYREQSRMRRDNITWTGSLQASPRGQLSASVLYTNLYYQTPGGLTLKEYEQNPRAARPAAGIFPSAIDAKAAIFQKTFLGGIQYNHRFNSNFKNKTTVYGAYAHIKNSAVRNFETRTEPHFGGRTVFTFYKKINNNNLQWHTGAEFQKGYFNITVNGNNKGQPDTLQTNDEATLTTYNIFTQATYSIYNTWYFTTGISLNNNQVNFIRLNEQPNFIQSRHFKNEPAPRFSILKKITPQFSILASAAKGFSPPTTAELLPSTGIINTALQAERGWNYELNLRHKILQKLTLQATGFYFGLNNALVQRRDEAGADYFTNAGSMAQKGLELQAIYLQNFSSNFINHLYINSGYTYSHFKYKKFVTAAGDYTGKKIPSVPDNTVSIIADAVFKKVFLINTTYYFATDIYLNDANTAAAPAYHLLGLRLGYKKNVGNIKLEFFVGADNILNQKYSLGNDINAVNGRYYNAAPERNYYAGFSIFKK